MPDPEDRLSPPNTKKGRLQRVLLALHAEHRAQGMLPTTGRFLFYELEQRGDATKPSPDDQRPNKRRQEGWPPGEQDVIDALRDLRERGIVPWDDIADETRRLDVWQHGPSIAAGLLGRLGVTRINPWGAEPPPLILCESRAVQSVLRALAARYVCPITGTAGQVNGFVRTRVAPALAADPADAPVRLVLYVGDLDDQGLQIEANTRRVQERATGRTWGDRWRRLALTPDQVRERGMAPIWKTDGRRRRKNEPPPPPRRAYEVEALGQRALLDLVDAALAALLPEPLARVLEREARQRARLRPILESLAATEAAEDDA